MSPVPPLWKQEPSPKKPIAEAKPGPIAADSWVVRKKSSILHRLFREKVLLCGRNFSQAYEVTSQVSDILNPVCKTCSRHMAE